MVHTEIADHPRVMGLSPVLGNGLVLNFQHVGDVQAVPLRRGPDPLVRLVYYGGQLSRCLYYPADCGKKIFIYLTLLYHLV